MKRTSFTTVCNLFILCFSLSCTHIGHNGNVNITISESGQYYKMYAHYNETHAKDVDRFINKHLAEGNSISFINTQVDADLTLDDGTKFYMKKSPGDLEIKFNKEENSAASYKKIKALAEGLKPVMQ